MLIECSMIGLIASILLSRGSSRTRLIVVTRNFGNLQANIRENEKSKHKNSIVIEIEDK